MNRTRLALGALAAGALLAYLKVVRPWHLRWGATDDELARAMPGDDLVARPLLNATRAVTIEAKPDEVWPWIVQMGYGRAGFYSYDWIDNDRRPSAERIIPELQDLKPGDRMPTGPDNRGFTVVSVQPPRALLLEIDEPGIRITLSTLLEEQEDGGSRMVMRARVWYSLTPARALYFALFDPGDFVMMRKMMLGIKRRAETLAQERPAAGTSREVA